MAIKYPVNVPVHLRVDAQGKVAVCLQCFRRKGFTFSYGMSAIVTIIMKSNTNSSFRSFDFTKVLMVTCFASLEEFASLLSLLLRLEMVLYGVHSHVV